MDKYILFFNQKPESANKAKIDFINEFGKERFMKEIQPFIDKGIMSIFAAKPNKYTTYYVNRVANYQQKYNDTQENFYKSVEYDLSNKSQAKSLISVRNEGMPEEVKKFDKLYIWLKENGYKPRIHMVNDIGYFYSITIQLPYTHQQLGTTQNVFFRVGFNSASYLTNEKIQLGIYVHKKK